MLKQLTNKFAKEETGAPIIEIVILIAMAAVLAAFLFPALRTNLGNWFNDIVANVNHSITGTDAANQATDSTGGTIDQGEW